MPDPACTVQCFPFIRPFDQILQFSDRFHNFSRGVTVSDRQPGRIISSVFQFGETVQQHGCCLLPSYVTYDSAHMMSFLTA
jgi:hypothetical protein